MTIYAVDTTKHERVAVWAQGVTHRALTIARLSDDMMIELAYELADELTMLSRAVWETYVLPASVADDEQERNQRDSEREGFGEVLEALRSPNLPSDTGLLLVSYSPVRERAHRVGRVLNKIARADLSDLIASDVKAELAAVEWPNWGTSVSERRKPPPSTGWTPRRCRSPPRMHFSRPSPSGIPTCSAQSTRRRHVSLPHIG